MTAVDTEMQLIDAQQQANKFTLKNLARNSIYALELTAMSKYEDKYLTSGRVSARLDTSRAIGGDVPPTSGNGQASSTSNNQSTNDAGYDDDDNDDDSGDSENDDDGNGFDEDDDLDVSEQQQPKSEPLLRDRPASSLKTERAPSSSSSSGILNN